MKKLLIASGLLALLTACGGTSTSDEGSDGPSSLGTMESGLLICGQACPTGYYVSSHYCQNSGTCAGGEETCMGDAYSMNATQCEVIPTDLNFGGCGVGNHLTSNHYIKEYFATTNCETTYTSTPPTNKSLYYVLPADDSEYATEYWACASSCPRSNHYVSGYDYVFPSDPTTTQSRGCGSVSDPNGKNSIRCLAPGWKSTYGIVCGTSAGICPSGFYTYKYDYMETCNQYRNGPTERNRSYCQKPTGTALYLCGDTCPSGYAAVSYSYSDDCRPSTTSSTTGNNRVYCAPI